MTSRPQIPLIVLAGSDRKPGKLPEGVEKQRLEGSKGLNLRIGDKPMVDVMIDRMRQVGEFGPIFIAGPWETFGAQRGDVEVIDTDSTMAGNAVAALEVVQERFPGSVVAISTCDIVPEIPDLERALAHYHSVKPVHYWFPVAAIPEDTDRLGESSWKPRYRMRDHRGEEPKAILPGHLLIMDPEAMRLGLVKRSFDLAYETRNRPTIPRTFIIAFGVLGHLLRSDIKILLKGHLPLYTYTVIRNGIMLGIRLNSGKGTRRNLENLIHRSFFRFRYRRKRKIRRGWMPIIDALSLAKDIDTMEEAREHSAVSEPKD